MLIDPPSESKPEDNVTDSTPKGRLVAWIMANVDTWRQHRDTNHKDEWDEYYRKWRAKFAAADKTRASERSQIITPATMQAVDSTVAEIEEAVFGREQWFDIDEDVKQSEDRKAVEEILAARDLMLEEANKNKVPAACSKAILMGGIWGTGIGKLNTSVKKAKRLTRGTANELQAETTDEVAVELIPLEPYEFIPDPTTDDIDEMLGCAHETIIPLHKIKQMIRDKAYFEDVKIVAYSGTDMPKGPRLSEATPQIAGKGVWIVEWHGKVPAKYLLPLIDKNLTPDLLEGFNQMDEDDSLVEAIVTIGNKSILLGAKRNPNIMGDRNVFFYQHDTIPSYVWGRGVPEKALNSQRTLDATVRARLDAMGLVAGPMFGGDVTRMPRGFNLTVYPGKFWPTTGSPGEILQRIDTGTINPELFSHANDAERMVGTATGAMDPSSDHSPNGQSATNTALNSASFIKKAKRALKNFERSFMQPLITKMMWRYMQFAPGKFPQNYDFRTRSALGVMAREFEQQQLTQLLSLVDKGTKPFLALLKAIFDNSASPHKSSVNKAIDEMLNPQPSPEQKEMAELAMREKRAMVAEIEAKAGREAAEAKKAEALAQKARVEAIAEAHRLQHESDALDLEYIRSVAEMRKAAGLEQQNAESDLSSQIRAQQVALQGIVKGIGAKQILAQSKILVEGANDGMDMVPGTQDDQRSSGQ